jgi:hypothetical protein
MAAFLVFEKSVEVKLANAKSCGESGNFREGFSGMEPEKPSHQAMGAKDGRRRLANFVFGKACRSVSKAYFLSNPSFSSIYGPQGSVMNAMEMPRSAFLAKGLSNFTPLASAFLQNASRSLISNPM